MVSDKTVYNYERKRARERERERVREREREGGVLTKIHVPCFKSAINSEHEIGGNSGEL